MSPDTQMGRDGDRNSPRYLPLVPRGRLSPLRGSAWHHHRPQQSGFGLSGLLTGNTTVRTPKQVGPPATLALPDHISLCPLPFCQILPSLLHNFPCSAPPEKLAFVQFDSHSNLFQEHAVNYHCTSHFNSHICVPLYH